MTGVTVRQAISKADIKAFIQLPYDGLYDNNPTWVPNLYLERADTINFDKNPFFEHGEAALFLAERGDKIVGRISAQIDQLHLKHHHPTTGFFGFLEAEDDAEVFAALFHAAEDWLRRKGMTHVRGPFYFGINEEVGLLVDGFDTPPAVLMPHANPWYGPRIEEQGLAKIMDMYAYELDVPPGFPARAKKIVAKAKSNPDLVIRKLDKSRYDAEIGIVLDIFNDAWSGNWGFVPFTEKEMKKIGSDLKPILDPGLAQIIEYKGRPCAFMITVPNLNEAIRDLNGKLLPFGWAKLIWRLFIAKVRSARVPLMGVRKEFQSKLLGAEMSLLLISDIRDYGVKKFGLERGELSWILENNTSMRRILEMIGCRLYKTYRIYEKTL